MLLFTNGTNALFYRKQKIFGGKIIFNNILLFFIQSQTLNETTKATKNAQQTVVDMTDSFLARLPYVAVGIAVFIIFFFVAMFSRKIVKMAAQKAGLDEMISSLIARVSYIIFIVLGLFIAAVVIFPGVEFSDLIAGLGLGSVGLGFAFKDVLQNLFAGFLILLYRPFKIGDQIRIDNFEGAVEGISLRATQIKTYDGERVVVPNNDLYMKSLTVRTAFPSRRTKIVVGIGYSDDHKEASKILLDILKNTDGVLAKPEPSVELDELAPSSVNMKMRYWTDSQHTTARVTAGKVVSATKLALDKAGIDMPFPHTVVELVKD